MRIITGRSVASVLGIALVVGSTGFMLQAEPPQDVDTWASIGTTDPQATRTGAALATLPDRTTLVAGGVTVEGTPTDSIVIHDPLTNASTTVGQLLAARVNAAATRLDDGRILITGGQVGTLISSDVEIFDPATGESTFAALLQQPRTGHASALLADGTVLIVGGTTVDDVVLATTERFDPSTNSVSAAEPMAVARTGASATTLIDGRVLVAGGWNGAQNLKSAEIYSAFEGVFLPVATQMSEARSGHSAVLLPHNNSVLIAGGTSGETAVTTTDLFLPAMFPDPYSWGMGSFGPTNPMVQPRSLAVAGPWGDDGYAFAMGGGSGDGEVYRFATIKTDKDDYAPGQLAVITGSGWAPLEEVTLTFQEDPAVHEDYVLTLTADDEGNIYYDEWAPEEHDLNVRFYLTAVGEQSHRRAQMTFTDSRMITGVTLDGVSIGASGSVTVAAGQSITAVVTVDTTGTNANARNWGATGWRISTTSPTVPANNAVYGSVTCVDHTDVTTAGVGHQQTFAITAPGAGTYHAYFIAFQGNTCTNDTGTADESAVFTGTNAVVVDAAVPTVVSINRVLGDPTNAASASWTVTFSESVTGVDTTDFALAASGLTSTSITGVTPGSGSSYTVTADTGNGSGTLGLNLVDNDSIIDAAGSKLGGTGLGNGSFTGETYILDRTLTPTITADNKPYDANTNATILTRGFTSPLAGTVPSTVAVTGGSATFDNANAGLGKTVTATGLSLTGAGSARFVLSSTSATTTANISQAALTINAVTDSKGYDGTTDSDETPVVVGTVHSPDSVTGLDQAFDSRNAGARTLTVTAYTVNDGNGGANYEVTTNTASGSIAQATLTINAVTDSKGYDGTTDSDETPQVVGTVHAPDSVTGLDQVFDSRNAGSRTLTASYTVNDGNGGANYAVTANTASGSISQAALTINAVTDSRGYDGTTDSDETPLVVGTVYGTDSVTGLDQVFDSRNAGSRTLTASYTVNDGNGGANYAVTANTAGGSIGQAELTINAVTDSKDYDGTTDSDETPLLVGTVYAPDSVDDLVQIFDSRNAGSRTLTASYTVNDGNGGANYAVTANAASGSINQAALTINAMVDSRAYDGTTDSDETPEVVGTVYSPDTIDDLVQVFDSRNVGPRTLTASYTVNDGNGGGNYVVTANTASGSISQAALAINAASDSREYDGTTDSDETPEVVGTVFSPDTVTGLDQEFDSRNAGARTLTVTAYTVEDGNGGANYDVTVNTANGSISQAALTINAVTDSKGYDGTTDSDETPTVAGTVYSPDTVSGLDQEFDSRNAGARSLAVTAYTVEDGNGGANYDVTVNTASGSIAQATLTINAVTDSKGYDGTTDSDGTPEVVGTVYSPDSVTDLDQVFDSRNAGSRTLTASYTVNDGNSGANYAVTANTASGSISQAALTINAVADSRGYDGTTDSDETPEVVGTVYSPDSVTGLDQVFDSRNAGSRTLTASYTVNDGNGGANYAVTANTASGSISQAALTINAVTDSKGYDGTADSDETPEVVGMVYSPDSVTGLDQVFDSRNAGSRTLTASYTVNDGNGGANYAVTANTASGSISQAALTINAVTDSKVYDGTKDSDETPLLVGTVYAPDSVTGLDQEFQSKNVMGSNASTLAVSAYTVNDGNNGNNYSVATNTANGTIIAKALTVTGITANNKPFNGNTVATLNVGGAALVGVVSPDVVTLNTAGATGTFASHMPGTHVVTIAGLTIGGADAGNYSLTQPTTTASITFWKLSGYLAPVGIANTYPGIPVVTANTIWNTVKGGQTVPLKFEMFTAVGGTELTSLSDVTGFALVTLPCTPGTEDPVDVTLDTPGTTTLGYDGSQYHLNWQTPKGANKCYRMTMTARDGSQLTAFFKAK